MNPILQVVIGEIAGIIIMFIALKLCSNASTIADFSAFIFGAIIIVGFIAMFLIGERNLYFSENILKNIFVVTFYEELICLASFFVSLFISGMSGTETDDKGFILLFLFIIFIASGLLGEEVFYKSIVKAMIFN